MPSDNEEKGQFFENPKNHPINSALSITRHNAQSLPLARHADSGSMQELCQFLVPHPPKQAHLIVRPSLRVRLAARPPPQMQVQQVSTIFAEAAQFLDPDFRRQDLSDCRARNTVKKRSFDTGVMMLPPTNFFNPGRAA